MEASPVYLSPPASVSKPPIEVEKRLLNSAPSNLLTERSSGTATPSTMSNPPLAPVVRPVGGALVTRELPLLLDFLTILNLRCRQRFWQR